MTILKTLAVKTGTYEKNGETMKRWKYVGHIHSGQYGEYMTIDASVNFAAFPRKDGDDRVMVTMFDYDQDFSRDKKSPTRTAKAATEDGGESEFTDDEIQF